MGRDDCTEDAIGPEVPSWNHVTARTWALLRRWLTLRIGLL
jgi:hypothetical protein